MTGAPAIRLAVPLDIAPDAVTGFDRNRRVVDLAGIAMGTSWRVRMAADEAFDPGPLQRRIAARLDALVTEMSHWTDTSRLVAFNLLPAGAWATLPPDFAVVVTAALEIAEASAGAFDPAIGRLTDAWGLGPRPRRTSPTSDEIEAALAVSGWRRLAYDKADGRLRQPGGLWLDLSGIAKGHAADVIARLLEEAGLRHALVEIGGECVGRGIRPDGDPWWVDLESPPGPPLPPMRVALHQLAVATSGSYVRGAHTLDPRTGRPAACGTTAVTVIHSSAMMADAWATALTVVPPEAAMDIADLHALPVRIVSDEGGERLSLYLQKMLQS